MPRPPQPHYAVMIAAYQTGATAAQIVGRFGVPASTVYRLLERANIPRRSSGQRRLRKPGNAR